MASTTWGTTVSSNPMIPSKSCAPRSKPRIRFSRISSFTERPLHRSSEYGLRRSSPNVFGLALIVIISAKRRFPSLPFYYNRILRDPRPVSSLPALAPLSVAARPGPCFCHQRQPGHDLLQEGNHLGQSFAFGTVFEQILFEAQVHGQPRHDLKGEPGVVQVRRFRVRRL